MSCTQQFQMSCDIVDCETITVEDHMHLPKGWHILDNKFICGNHTITVDGEKVEPVEDACETNAQHGPARH